MLFKFTDAFSGTMTAPFVIDLGFTRNDYAAIVKGVGLAATLIGGFAGGFVARRYSLTTSLWIGGVLQAVANLSFSWLAFVGVNQWALAFAITAENFTSAIGTVIFVAYLSALCRNPLHTATQYALLTALAAVGRTYLSSGAGYVAKAAGWPMFFVDLHAGRNPEPDPARLAASPRAFRGAGTGEGLALVVPREGGGPSIPEQLRLNRESRGVLGRPVPVRNCAQGRAMTAEWVATTAPPQCLVTTLHLVMTASLICPASCAQATSSTLTEISLPMKFFSCAAWASLDGDQLERLGAGFEIAQPARRRQPARFAGDLVGRGALALLAALHGVEFAGQDVAGIDRLAGLRRRLGLLRPCGRCRQSRGHDDDRKAGAFAESSFRHVDQFRRCGLEQRSLPHGSR